MLVNSKLTHYHKTFDKVTRLDKWVKYNYDKVHWVGGKGARFNKGLEELNDCKIRIWYSLNNVDVSNFKEGDLLVKGHLELNIMSQSDLKDYQIYKVNSIVDNSYGILEMMKHIHIEGK